MDTSNSCKSCGERRLVTDDVTGNLVCMSCGVVQDFNNYQSYFGDITGPIGTNVRLGTAGSGSTFNYKEKKVYEAQKMIKDLTFKLGLSELRSDEVKRMVERVTDGEFGKGEWFPIFVGACANVVMRRDKKILTIVEVADLVGCDIYALGRMIKRVVDFLVLKLPEFDIVGLLERSIRTCTVFNGVSEDLIRRILKQGVFLLQCSMKWYLTTGRRPIPVVAAVLVFVAKMNEVEVKIEDLASELHVAVRTCKTRYKELLERLVKVARVLPWGNDVNVKNIIKNGTFVMQYMELKSMSKDHESSLEQLEFNLDEILGECSANESHYFEVDHSSKEPDRFPISHESLALLYSDYLEEYPLVKSSAEKAEVSRRNNKGMFNNFHVCEEWWTGKSDLSKKLLIEKIIEKDIGLNANPPSFDQGCLNQERRRKKIDAAMLRIERIMHPSKSDSAYEVDTNNNNDSSAMCVGKKKRKKMEGSIDWEDFIIETLLLHKVKEDEIEKGYYKALLDLYVFSG